MTAADQRGRLCPGRRLRAWCWALPALAWASTLHAATSEQPLGWLSDFVSRHGFGLGLLAVFGGGLALNLTPCVYPMVPVTMAFFTSQAAGAWKRALALALAYVAGLSVNYALLGLMAAKTGAFFGSWLQHPVVLAGIALLIVMLALGMLGWYDLRLPQALASRVGRSSAGLWGAFGMGFIVGLIAAPCIGPFVAGLLLLVGQLADPAAGFLLFLVLGLGMGLPYLVLGVAANRISQLPKAGPWLMWVKKGLGVVLLAVALYFVKPLVPGAWLGFAVAGLLGWAGAYLGWLEKTPERRAAFLWIRRAVGGGLLLASLLIVWPRPPASAGVVWTAYSTEAFEQARQQGRPVLIDVYADWCLPCIEMDHVTFRHPKVVEALASVATLRLDATTDISADGQTLVQRYDVFGAPTVLFFDRSGRERAELRLLGFAEPEEFLARLRGILLVHPTK